MNIVPTPSHPDVLQGQDRVEAAEFRTGSDAEIVRERPWETMSDTIDAKIREVLDGHAKLRAAAADLAADDDLYRAGLTSHASVSVMLALEDGFEVEFTDDMLRKSTFQSIAAIRQALLQVGVTE